VSEAVWFYVERLGFALVFQDAPDRRNIPVSGAGPWNCTCSFSSRKTAVGTVGQAMLRLVVDDPGA
jgi:hypothetical protein